VSKNLLTKKFEEDTKIKIQGKKKVKHEMNKLRKQRRQRQQEEM
jgi:hypothetical protein